LSCDLFQQKPSKTDYAVSVATLLSWMAIDSGICIDPDPAPGEPPSQQCWIAAARFAVGEGLVLTCGWTGKRYRLRIMPEELSE
jgi:hypothetical protein